MKFKVKRTSWPYGEPCDEAFKDGKNEWGETIYCVNINTLEEMMAFIGKYGMIVLKEDEIEIYDDYRE